MIKYIIHLFIYLTHLFKAQM